MTIPSRSTTEEKGRRRVLFVLGTRPEAIKLAPVVLAMRARPDAFHAQVCVTAQHREMLDSMLAAFGIEPDFDLDVMQAQQSLPRLTGRLFERLEPVMDEARPDWILVQGDTTSTMVGSLSGFYRKIPIAHVEAGLRTGDRSAPFPEEINRRITDLVADLFFAPTERACRNLLAEGVDPARIHVTGNTGIDALLYAIEAENQRSWKVLETLPASSRIVLVTAHRRENLGRPLEAICRALREIAETRDDVHIVFPVHPNPAVSERVYASLEDLPRVTLLPPLDYFSFAQLLARCDLVLTDSGGIQEEAPSLGKPVLILREATERPEAVEAGNARIIGTDPIRIVKEVARLLSDPRAYRAMAQPSRVFGDGHASDRICEVLSSSGEESSSRRIEETNEPSPQLRLP